MTRDYTVESSEKCSNRESDEKCIKILVRKPERKRPVEAQVVITKIINKWV
jgi:hypothetical protein